jgi:hypothetical protein
MEFRSITDFVYRKRNGPCKSGKGISKPKRYGKVINSPE